MTENFAMVESTRVLTSGPTFLPSRIPEVAKLGDRVATFNPEQLLDSKLRLALDDREVYASITGPKKSGKSQILAAVINDARAKSRICITVLSPDKMDEAATLAVNKSIKDALSTVSQEDLCVLIAVDNFQKASDPFLTLLTEFAQGRHSLVPTQVIVAGEFDQWARLDRATYNPLRNRIAIRVQL